jgi:hypothetical protein
MLHTDKNNGVSGSNIVNNNTLWTCIEVTGLSASRAAYSQENFSSAIAKKNYYISYGIRYRQNLLAHAARKVKSSHVIV